MTTDELDIAEAVFRHQLRGYRGAVAFLALGTVRDDPDPALLARLAGDGPPIKPVSAANTSERTQSQSSSTTTTLPAGPWWRKLLAIVGLVPTGTVTSGTNQQISVVVRRLTDAETGAVGSLIRVGAIRRLGPDEAEAEVEVSGEPLPTVESVCRLTRADGGWTVAELRPRR